MAKAILPRDLTNFLLAAARGGGGGEQTINVRVETDLPAFVEVWNEETKLATPRSVNRG